MTDEIVRKDPLGLCSAYVDPEKATEESAWVLDSTDRCPKCQSPMEALSGANNTPLSVCLPCRITLPSKNP